MPVSHTGDAGSNPARGAPHATVVSGRKHTALPAPQTGFDSRRSLSWGSWWPGWWLATTRAGFDSPGLHSLRQSENRSRGARSRGSLKASASRPQLRPGGGTRSRTRLVARLGCLPGEAGSTPAESAQTRRSSAEPSTTLRRWGTEVRILPARLILVRERKSAQRNRAARIPACGGADP